MTQLNHITRCPAKLANGDACNSAIFYDWGLQILDSSPMESVTGPSRFQDYNVTRNVHICARCTTPYLLVEGSLTDIGDELSAEDIRLILSRRLLR